MAQQFQDHDLVILFRAPEEDNLVDPYIQAVERCKKRAVCVPVLGFKHINLQALYKALCEPKAYSGLILTSPRAVKAVVEATSSTDWVQSYCLPWSKLPTFVVGQATEQGAKELGLATVGEDSGSAESLLPHILQRIPPGGLPLLFPCGNLRRETIPAALRKHGVIFVSLTVYETSAAAGIRESLHEVINTHGLPNALVYYSPSGVRFTWAELEALHLNTDKIDFVAIGPTTKNALLDQGVRVAAVAAKPTPQGLMEAILSLNRLKPGVATEWSLGSEYDEHPCFCMRSLWIVWLYRHVYV